MKTTSHGVITGFTGLYRCLANEYESPIELEGLRYPTVEHAYQACKVREAVQRHMFTIGTVAEAVANGRRVEIREDWDSARLRVMRTLVQKKFLSNRDNGVRLLCTGNYWLVNENSTERFWGVVAGKGQNQLGKILMDVRNEIMVRAGYASDPWTDWAAAEKPWQE